MIATRVYITLRRALSGDINGVYGWFVWKATAHASLRVSSSDIVSTEEPVGII